MLVSPRTVGRTPLGCHGRVDPVCPLMTRQTVLSACSIGPSCSIRTRPTWKNNPPTELPRESSNDLCWACTTTGSSVTVQDRLLSLSRHGGLGSCESHRQRVNLTSELLVAKCTTLRVERLSDPTTTCDESSTSHPVGRGESTGIPRPDQAEKWRHVHPTPHGSPKTLFGDNRSKILNGETFSAVVACMKSMSRAIVPGKGKQRITFANDTPLTKGLPQNSVRSSIKSPVHASTI